MRVFVVASALLLFLPSAPASAQQGGAAAPRQDSPPQAAPSQAAPSKETLGAETLDQLFATLAKPGDEAAGEAVESEIERRWLQSGSDTVDLLMTWSAQSIATKNYGRALDFLDAVVMLKPDFAEGWNRRATVFYMQDEYGKAISDIEKVLALEPRHFGALAGLGLMLRDMDRKADALAALERAVAIDPYLSDDVTDAIKELKHAVDGQDI
jgi:tetratricopeptide (TPR) repeat protein